MSTSVVLLAFILMGTTSCSKYNSQPAKLVIGEYIGSGTDSDGIPYTDEIIRISRISDKRIKVEPVGHLKMMEFEIDIEGGLNKVFSLDDSQGTLAAQHDNGVTSIGIASSKNEQFAGTKL